MQFLNLARKWRCKSFSEIKGQNLIVRFLQNSLYRALFYPVYLFSGMRGTGKTTTARLFAASMLCKNLSLFKTNPANVPPCYSCDSCSAFLAEQHPDICEIDAASHTGVETIRSLIDNAYLLPVLSEKKIYIIDEVHMLTKAAFNACLKIMEEPPQHVHFILATTDVCKVLDTIRSRSIQLYFEPVEMLHMVEHLEEICSHESIAFERDALVDIVKKSQGSVRDALNALERVRMVTDIIDTQSVNVCLGSSSSAAMAIFVDAFIKNNYNEAVCAIQSAQKQIVHAQSLWGSICSHVRELLAGQTVIIPEQKQRLLYLLHLLYKYESLYMHSSSPMGLLELLCHQGFLSAPPVESKTIPEARSSGITAPVVVHKQIDQVVQPIEPPSVYSELINEIDQVDKVLASIFRQAKITYVNEKNTFFCELDKRFLFYRDFISGKKLIWRPLLDRFFGENSTFDLKFNESNEIVPPVSYSAPQAPQVVQQKSPPPGVENNNSKSYVRNFNNKTVPGIVVKENEKSAFAKELSRIFPGVTEKVVNNNES